MPTATIQWNTQHDDRVCPICQAIEGYTWIFEGQVPDSLEHPQFGEVWNKIEGSGAHGHKDNTCRCHLKIQISAKDLLEKLKKLRDDVQAAQGTDTP